MKKTLQLLLILLCGKSYGQTIFFTKEKDAQSGALKIVSTYDNSELKIPVNLIFPAVFKNDKIEIVGDAGTIANGTFGTDPVNPHGGTDKPYQIEIRPNDDDITRLMVFPFKQNCPTDGSRTLNVKINGLSAMTIKYKYIPEVNEEEKA